EIHLSAGAVRVARPRCADFTPSQGRWEGIERKTHSSLLTVLALNNVTLTGRGVVDGQGRPWWQPHAPTRARLQKLDWAREAETGVKNVTIDNCVIVGCHTGIYIRSPRGRGGVIERVRCTNLVIDGMVEAAVKLSHFFDSVRMENRFGEATAPTKRNPETDR